MPLTRRSVLAGVTAAVGLSGCLGGPSDGAVPSTTQSPGSRTTGETLSTSTDVIISDGAPPVADRTYHLAYNLETLDSNIVSGGVPKDGIPPIETPRFASPDAVEVDDDDPVFGVVRNGVAKAYPQQVLVFHEIVNDEIGGEPVSITYCPLTGTVQGFPRGATSFGVSGKLLNNNLVMYDRATDTRFPQILATGVRGDLAGRSLPEFRLVWTTKAAWVSRHPETTILTRDTGYARRYGSDPYGSYNPLGGYYESGGGLFQSLHTDDRADPKAVVIGARTDSEAISVAKDRLLLERIVTIEATAREFVAVSDPHLSTGYIYHNPDGVGVRTAGSEYRVDGGTHAADALPLERVLAFDAMWHAWAGFYPETTYVG